ncbi:unnamed protein product [Symbiodinium necroappetens]|uniref:Uncharacterized protein n=1 Tax=Symbiodinium necroappetens TaxID=1628268 RepID=A0A812RXM0_9DINO|nr:unnamed protein product [Symbiodinium necroappetens]
MLSIGLEDTLAYYNADDFVAGFKKMLASQVRVIKQNEARQVAWLSIGMEDRLASCTIAAFAAGFLKSVAFQMRVINQVEHGLVRDTLCKVSILNMGVEVRVIKQSNGSSGDGIWIMKLVLDLMTLNSGILT